jgi:hypothetical protein
MHRNPILSTRAAAAFFALAVFVGASCAASAQMGGGQPDKRKQTTIQTSKHGSVEVRYLNLPWGEKTFSYMEVGGSDYYSTRTWPFAHLTLEKAATWQGNQLAPGDYVLYITPKGAQAPMSLTVASFKPGASGTFLVAGDVFTETPKDASTIATVPVTFDKKGPVSDELKIDVSGASDGHDVVVHYGDRWLTTHLSSK